MLLRKLDMHYGSWMQSSLTFLALSFRLFSKININVSKEMLLMLRAG